MKSWKTTLAGIGGILGAIGLAVKAQYDNDPSTIPDWSVVAGAVMFGIGLIFAADNPKNAGVGEDVGAK